MKKIRLSDLPPAVRAQIAVKLEGCDTKQGVNKGKDSPPLKTAVRAPNRTEQRYYDDHLSHLTDVRYEPITFRLKNGHRYTPDWVVFREGLPRECIEVKGSYRFGSQNRSQMAWAQARLDFPGLRWVWAMWDDRKGKKQWKVKEGG